MKSKRKECTTNELHEKTLKDLVEQISEKYDIPEGAAMAAVIDFGEDVMKYKMHVCKDADEMTATIIDLYSRGQVLTEIREEFDYFVVVYKDKEA